ncbi:MAG: 2-oxoglutarate dehydrogenase complex dihydrolipoyllysine-residue succinyltransferase [Deltaproteobacteria bacterium]|nr:2-oxoglutarate dehydrogenase complex dihydrolipoyllysine-residue succinyltransferase [Deltaproteobacteria bacterium]
MIVEVKVPEVGESITEGVIVEWFKKSGEAVKKDEPLFELETDKITMQIESEVAGVLSIVMEQGDVEIGQVVGSIDTAATAVVPTATSAPSAASASSATTPVTTPAAEAVADEPTKPVEKLSELATVPLSPAARHLVDEHAVDPRSIQGSGKDGRITKEDVLAALEEKRTSVYDPVEKPAAALSQELTLSAVEPAEPEGTQALEVRESRKKMTSLRRRIAQRLVEVQQEAAILTTFNEADMSGVMALRKRYKQSFVDRHGVKLGMMSFFVKAAVEALKTVPAVNTRIDGDEIVTNHYYDIGVAVGTERGLVVPVLRGADRLGFAEIEAKIADFAVRARDRRLELSDLQGGCFTISNGGVYGSMLSTPILNPPQSGILGMHSIKKRPMVVGDDDRIEVRPMMYVALSYDHRLVDGLEAVTFLKRLVDCIEEPQRLLFEV